MIVSCSAWIVAGPPGVNRGEQRRLARQPPGLRDGRGVVQVEHLVVHRGHLAAPGAQVPAPPDALWGCSRGRIERACRRCAPVHQQRFVLVLLVQQPEPPDVAPLAVVGVKPTERQSVLRSAQGRETVGVHRGRGVALRKRLRRAHRLVVQHAVETLRGIGAPGVEALVEHGYVLALVLDPILGGRVPRGAVAHDVVAVMSLPLRAGDVLFDTGNSPSRSGRTE
jgi:hypothetical protein